MKKIRLLFFLIILITGCSKDSQPAYQLLTADYLENADLFHTVGCFSVTEIHGEYGIVINDEETYALYADSMRIDPVNLNCDTATLIDIDFSKYTLIGIQTEHSSCDLVSKEIAVHNADKEIEYSIFITEGSISPCNYMLMLPLNLVMVPKIPEGYKVVFNVIRNVN